MGGSSAGLRSFDHRCGKFGSQNAASFAAAARAPGPGARRINQRAGTGAADSARRTERGRARPFAPIHPLKNLDPTPDRSRGLGQRFPIWVADSLLCEPARDRAGDGDELIGTVWAWALLRGCATLPRRRGVSPAARGQIGLKCPPLPCPVR